MAAAEMGTKNATDYRSAAEKSSTSPIRILKTEVDGCRWPPKYAAGIDSSANGQNNFHAKCPARQNWNAPMDATRMLSTSAVGRIIVGASPNSVIVAM